MYSYIFLMHQVRRRVKALKKLQLDATNLEAKFYEEVYALEKKYHALHNPLYQQRASITDVSIVTIYCLFGPPTFSKPHDLWHSV